MKKICFFVLLLLFFLLNSQIGFCQNKLNSIQFSIGGSIDNFIFTRINSRITTQKSSNTEDFIFSYKEYMFSTGFSFGVTFNTVFNFSEKFGIGIKVQTGLSIYFPGMYYNDYDKICALLIGSGINNDILFVNKIYLKEKKAINIEYGISSLLAFFGTMLYKGYGTPGGFFEYYIGPKLFIGFDRNIKKNYNILIGGFLESNFKVYPISISYNRGIFDYIFNNYPDYTLTKNDLYNFFISTGVQIRFNYTSLIKHK